MQSNCTHHNFPDRSNLTDKLAAAIANVLATGISDRGKASLAVSGGSTPVDLFHKLSAVDIAWKQVFITLVDERWVEAGDADSNEKLVRTHLLQNKAAAASFVGMKNGAATANAGEAECEEQLRTVPLPFDVVILGMGGDGHTASFFPGAENLAAATDMHSNKMCIAITPLTAPHERMTLTLPAILNTKEIFLHITGTDKQKVLQTAEEDGPLEELPIRFILSQQSTPCSVYWAE